MIKSFIIIAAIIGLVLLGCYLIFQAAISLRASESEALREDAETLRETRENLADIDYAEERRAARRAKYKSMGE